MNLRAALHHRRIAVLRMECRTREEWQRWDHENVCPRDGLGYSHEHLDGSAYEAVAVPEHLQRFAFPADPVLPAIEEDEVQDYE